jgi:hypothetical protein
MTAITPALRKVAATIPATGISPHIDVVRDWLAEWIVHTGMQDTAMRHWREARFESLLARMYPTLPVPTLLTAAQTTMWLFLVDGHLDPGAAGGDPRHSALFAARVAVLTPDAAPAVADPLVRNAWELSTATAVPAGRRGAFVGHLREFAWAMHLEVADRARGHTPSVDEYLTARAVTSGWDLLADFAEASCPADILALPEYQVLRHIGGEITFTVNDIISLPKEIESDEYHNLVLLRMRADGGPLGTALARVDDWLGGLVDEYLAATAALRATCAARGVAATAVHDCIAALAAVVRGTLDWSLETGRYSIEEGLTR